MDIIVIKLPDGTLKSTAFHIRFGSLSVNKIEDRTVVIYLNGHHKRIKMKLFDDGDAYFDYELSDLKVSTIRKSKVIEYEKKRLYSKN